MDIASRTSYIIEHRMISVLECKKWRGPFEKKGVWKRSKSDTLRLGGNAKHSAHRVCKKIISHEWPRSNTVKLHKLGRVLYCNMVHQRSLICCQKEPFKS